MTMLQKKEKWPTIQPNIPVAQVVLLKQLSAPFMWPLAIIEAVVPDSNDAVRIVTVRTRSTTKLVMFAT